MTRPAVKPVIALAFVSRGQFPDDVLFQWIEILRRRHWPGPLFFQRDLYVVSGRNRLTTQALESRERWTHLSWMDADELPTPDRMTRLMEVAGIPDVDLSVGAYYGRSWPFLIQVFEERPTGHGLRNLHPQKLLDYRARPGLYPVGGGGTGNMMIRRELLERMQSLKGRGRVWEAHPIDPDLLDELRAEGEDVPGAVWSEDIWFCVEARERLGTTCWFDSDPRAEVAHLGTQRIDFRHWQAATVQQVRAGQAVALEQRGYRLEVAGG